MKVVVVGGGFAGLSAAIALQERRHDVLLLERRGILGGRAAASPDALSGEPAGSGTHLLLAGWRETLDLLGRAGADRFLAPHASAEWTFVDAGGATNVLRCPDWPAPLHAALGMLGMRVPGSVRRDLLRLALGLWKALPDPFSTLAAYLVHRGQGDETRRRIWNPLAAVLAGDTPERLAARPFVHLLHALAWGDGRHLRLVSLPQGLAAVHQQLAAYFKGRGGTLRRRALAEDVDVLNGRATAVRYVQRAETRDEIRAGKREQRETARADAVVLAVPWTAVGPLVPEDLRTTNAISGLGRLVAVPAVTVELWVDRVVMGPPAVLVQAGDAVLVVDRGRPPGSGQHLAVRLAPDRARETHTNAEWIALARAAVELVLPVLAGAEVRRALVFKEPQATFAGDPASHALRPGPTTDLPNLFLAGDWTDTGLPASIEGAVRSGRAAALRVEALASKA